MNSDIDDAASGDESDVLVAPEDRCPSLRATVRFSLPPEPSEENLKLKEVYFKLKAASDTLNQAVTEYNDAILAESTESTENTENTENTPTSPASDTPSTKKPKLSAEEN